jgi:DNA-binding transcriptional LysR family regulator
MSETAVGGGLDLQPRLLAQFVALVDHGDVRAAADELALPPRVLSRAIRELEHQTREPLLDRGARTVVLTPAGERLARSARRVLEAVDRFDALVATDRGTLHVAHVANADTLSAILDFAADSGVAARVVEDTMGDELQIEELVRHRLDLAVCSAGVDLPDGLEATPLRLDPLVVIEDADGPLDAGGAPLLTPEYGPAWPAHDALTAAVARAAGWTLERVPVPAGSGRELRTLLRHGVGRRALVASSTLPRGGAMMPLRRIEPVPFLRWRAVWRAGDTTPALDALVDAARRVAAVSGWLDAGAARVT